LEAALTEDVTKAQGHHRTLTRREFLRYAGVSAAAGLAACSVPPALTPTRSGPVRLVYRDWRTDWFPLLAQQMLEEFHASHPNIRVYYVLDPDSDDFEDKTIADFQAGVAPDVFQGCCSFFPIWAQKDYTLDLRPYVQADLDRETIADWDPVQYQSFFAPGGKQYGLPKYHGALALYYNKDLFDKYRVDYPNGVWSYDDYLAAMRLLTHDTDGDGQIDQWGSMADLAWERIQVHVNGWGGHFVNPNDPTHSYLAQPATLQALEWLRARMWDDKVMATPLDVQKMGTNEAFIAGKLAMVEDGSWALKSILTEAKFRVGVVQFPEGPVRHATLATTDGFGIYAGTQHPDAAWELIKFLISKDYGRAMARTHLLQPARASLVGEWVRFVNEEFPNKAKDLDVIAFAEGHLRGYSVISETFANQSDAQRLVSAAFQQIFALGKSPVESMKETSREVEELQPRSR
jgi:multiple sugar transport system substrate-binding protein